MIIFVEGADGSGKSTLVKTLSEQYPIVNITRKAEHINADLFVELMRMHTDVVCERGPISDYVYRLLDGDPSVYSLSRLLGILKNSVVIYCRTDTQYKDSINRGEDLITDKKEAEKLKNTYDVMMSIFAREGVKLRTYNWKKDKPEDITKFIKEVRVI